MCASQKLEQKNKLWGKPNMFMKSFKICLHTTSIKYQQLRSCKNTDPNAPCIDYLPPFGEQWPHFREIAVSIFPTHVAFGRVLVNLATQQKTNTQVQLAPVAWGELNM